MNSLRRDLFERRLWPIVAVLLLAIIAVPFLLDRHHATVSTTFPDAPLATPTTRAGAGGATYSALSASAPRTMPAGDSKRDPFGAGGSTTATTSATQTTGSSGTATTTTGDSATSSTTTSTPTSSGSGSADSSAATLAAALNGAEGSTTPTTTISSPSTTSSTPTATTTSASSPGSGASTAAAATHRYTVRVVDIHLKTPSGTLSVVDAARLSPLPSASSPKVMFIGTAVDGSAAVFALNDTVTATGPATCRPAHDNCALIELPPRRIEKISYWLPNLGERTLELEVTRIASSVTTSRTEALAAYARRSAVGLCELQLGDPLQYQYDTSDGSLASQSGSACTRRMAKVPFPGQASGSGL